jgi:hypothetical protein
VDPTPLFIATRYSRMLADSARPEAPAVEGAPAGRIKLPAAVLVRRVRRRRA